MVRVRFEQPDDAAAVRDINEQAFGSPIEARIVESLRGAPDCLSLVATTSGPVVGHILFSPVSLEPPVACRVAGLGPMSVRPDHQRAGIGSQLIRAGLDACRQHGYSAVVVVGYPEYYPRFGFCPASQLSLRSEYDVPEEAFMVKELRGGTNIEKVREANDRLQYAEGEADKVMLTLLKDLYHGPYEAKELVILQELYEMVEQAVDRCRNAGNIVVQIVLKHS